MEDKTDDKTDDNEYNVVLFKYQYFIIGVIIGLIVGLCLIN